MTHQYNCQTQSPKTSLWFNWYTTFHLSLPCQFCNWRNSRKTDYDLLQLHFFRTSQLKLSTSIISCSFLVTWTTLPSMENISIPLRLWTHPVVTAWPQDIMCCRFFEPRWTAHRKGSHTMAKLSTHQWHFIFYFMLFCSYSHNNYIHVSMFWMRVDR